MPWIRYQHWQRAKPLMPHLVVCSSGRRYLWKGDQAGVTFVPFRADTEELLHGQHEIESPYALAYERYGISFDAQGKEITPPPLPEPPPVPERSQKSLKKS